MLRYSKFVKLFGASSSCYADFIFEVCAGGLPYVDEPAFIERLNSLIGQQHIDYGYPGL